MFRKPKKTVKKSGIRSRISEDEEDDKQEDRTTIKRPVDDEDEGEGSTTALLSEAKKRTRLISGKAAPIMTSETTNGKDKNVMHQYTSDANDSLTKRKTDLVTSTVEIHSEKQQNQNQGGTAERGDDGIFRDKTRSKLLAGPIKATTHIRTTCRFDYQPDICKDYKETGFCGFGDTCIYLHDRGDTLTGWQLEQKWEEEQKKKKERQEREIQGFMDGTNNENKTNTNDGEEIKGALAGDDGLPYACHICREYFKNPVVTSCNHYFCESCIMNKVKTESPACPICGKDTHGVFNKPTKLLSKRRRVLGASKASQENAWEEFSKALSGE